jgi:hypothetical protein
MCFPFCTHFIISSITPSVKVRPKTSGNADAGLEDGARKLPSDSPDCGMAREGMVIVDLPENGRIREARGDFEVVLARCQVTTQGDAPMLSRHAGGVRVHLFSEW